mmetsp:Transcript_6720/g.19414  ORF Transcript_6720/g.19414 Transcript_6720/m.19414 type:complete len:863 (+) Transcript_6720:231-2819(+)|eukprot:CAMPEP_0172359020 /NCGR_PEP_ID=MMETSP1060-20121228/3250_1 /TAXON_ID=37318 /ORGANISM="Pseudo-nitzschia pungens, Strain cf. cingulata" /LENGTH=862 /DNA_ID=CAMNT_0013080469 /DNA_START=175 /DNA_END=2763 /DNA_ORIENTATION=-
MADNTLSVKIGGRIVSPHLPIVDGSPPSAIEQSFDRSLQGFVKDNIPLESTEGIQTRERVLSRMGVLCRAWIKSVCEKRGLPREVVNSAGGQLFTAGSYRLGIHEPGADIDALLVMPSVCTRQDIFGTSSTEDGETAPIDPDSLAERVKAHPDVTNFVPVEGAAVPILTFDWEGVNIDLLFARLNTACVPPDFDIDNDASLDGVDAGTSRTMNATRVTNLIAALVSGTRERYQTFLTVVRCVRKWAKARGLYSNKMGYWGGVNINIAVALCVQLYPNSSPASLLRRFFLVFKTWRWPRPLMLTKPHDAGYGLPVWAQGPQTARQVAPMLTPAYPSMTSMANVSRQTLQIFHEEFCRGFEIVDRLWKQHVAKEKQKAKSGVGTGDDPDPLDWNELFRPSDFFIAYPYYLSLCIVGPTQADEQAWVGFVESRLRILVSGLLGKSLPLSKIQLWPKKIEACVADRSALLTMDQRRNSITYFVGFQVDKLRMRGSQLNVELQMQHFRDWELSRFSPLVPGMDIMTKTFTCKHLPPVCFEMYDGGKLDAMKRRRMLRNIDPKRQERRRAKRLVELKAKMAEIQKRKAAAASNTVKAEDEDGEAGRKRKRSNSEIDEEAEQTAAVEEDLPPAPQDDVAATVDGGNNGEEDLLENALDTLQESEGGERKTREDAEADRKKLLSGELLVEGAEVHSDDDEDLDFIGDGEEGRRSFVVQRSKSRIRSTEEDAKLYRDIRALPMKEEEAQLLRSAGYTVVSDAETETQIIGGNMPTPFRSRIDGDDDGKGDKDASQKKSITRKPKATIQFRTKFDIVELDAAGHVIDKGDNDFTPSKSWIGRKAGFEFKLGERGLGYYRTGKKVVVPSNTAY